MWDIISLNSDLLKPDASHLDSIMGSKALCIDLRKDNMFEIIYTMGALSTNLKGFVVDKAVLRVGPGVPSNCVTSILEVLKRDAGTTSFIVYGARSVLCLGFGVLGLGFWVWGLGFGVLGFLSCARIRVSES
jgi:hypothetical protein